MTIHIFLTEIQKDRPGPDSELHLLRAGLRAMGAGQRADTFSAEDLAAAPDGKPFFRSFPDIHFNLSHSGEYLAGAFSSDEVGLDLQENRASHTGVLRIAKRFFTMEEYESLLSCGGSREQELLFYRLWTIKEAYLKYLGCGLHGSLSGFRPDPMPDCRSPRTLSLSEDNTASILLCPPRGQAALQPLSPAARGAVPAVPSAEPLFSGTILRKEENENTRDENTGDSSPCSHSKHSETSPVSFFILPAPAGYTMTLCGSLLLHCDVRIRQL